MAKLYNHNVMYLDTSRNHEASLAKTKPELDLLKAIVGT